MKSITVIFRKRKEQLAIAERKGITALKMITRTIGYCLVFFAVYFALAALLIYLFKTIPFLRDDPYKVDILFNILLLIIGGYSAFIALGITLVSVLLVILDYISLILRNKAKNGENSELN